MSEWISVEDELPKNKGNICQFCDFRGVCESNEWDFEDSNNRCMSYPIVSAKTGEEITRNDGCSVVFKRIRV
jgi:hypothetical protein